MICSHLSPKHELVMCDAAFVELCVFFGDRHEAETFLRDRHIKVVMPSKAALCEAGTLSNAMRERFVFEASSVMGPILIFFFRESKE
jgi:hypothetical protein